MKRKLVYVFLMTIAFAFISCTKPSQDENISGKKQKENTLAVTASTKEKLEWIVVDTNEREPERTIEELIESLAKGLFPDGTKAAQGSQNEEDAQSGAKEEDDLEKAFVSTVTFSDEPWENKTVEYTDITALMFSESNDENYNDSEDDETFDNSGDYCQTANYNWV